MPQTLRLTQAAARRISELNARTPGVQDPKTSQNGNKLPPAHRGSGQDPALLEVILDLSLLELQELAAIAWLGGDIFDNFDEALRCAKVLDKWELGEFLEIAPGLSELERGIQLLEESPAIHLS